MDFDPKKDILGTGVPADAHRYTDPMRVMHQRQCVDCKFEYRQPSKTGNCPRCHGPNVNTVDASTIYAPRV